MIPVLFNILLFTIPLIFYKGTSELFEFNKIVALYGITTIIASIWIINSIRAKKFIFRQTLLDWPLVIYLSIYLVSSLFSIDPRTSFLGYYSRFNGGLISQICYAILYWAFVSNVTAKNAKQSLVFGLWSLAIASALAILEHFGVFTTCGLMGLGYKESCWVQDVQSRVFSTLGQPNWLAALLVAMLPISNFQFLISNQFSINKFSFAKLGWFLITIQFFVTLLFTKSRSGLLAFGIEAIIFWGFVFWQSKLKYLKELTVLFLVLGLLYFVISYRPINQLTNSQPSTSNGPALEVGGTESGTIRKYVWLGALEVFKNYPILGSGPETFAFSYPMFKPVAHNLTSEWDFIYNKAHNEFLNYLATTGIIGTLSYLSLIFFSYLIFFKSKRYDLFAGYTAILATNFFGFSVVPVSLLFFLFPAIALAQNTENTKLNTKTKQDETQMIFVAIVLGTTLYTLFSIHSYWQADINYLQAKTLNRQGNPIKARDLIEKAIKTSKKEPLYWAEASNIDSDIAILSAEEKRDDQTNKFIQLASQESKISTDLSSKNINLKRTQAGIYYKLASFNENYLELAEKTLKDAISITPFDPKLYYQLGILQLKLNKNEEAVKNLEKSVELKTNYKDGRFALGSVYKDLGDKTKAFEQFTYILDNIDTKDDLSKKYLLELN
jgi:tetratricopeptide (TPR) repeat protein